MSLNIQNVSSPNFGIDTIPVEFLVLHYTACELRNALAIFTTQEKKLCAHFVIDLDGSIYDLGHFWKGPIRQGAHAGVSRFSLDGKIWEAFNNFSIGIEIVNLNGNILSYTKEQYEALILLTRHLCSRFPALRDPNRIVGHEHIAGFRGKSDPGLKFDWTLFFKGVYPTLKTPPSRESVINEQIWEQFEIANGKVDLRQMKGDDWSALSSDLEKFMATYLKS